jgi:hypothetical protein
MGDGSNSTNLAGQECGGGFLTKMLDSFEEADGRQVFIAA